MAEATPVESIIARLSNVKEVRSGEFMARCPSHDDDTASLSVKTGKDGRALLFCHARCETSAIVSAIGLDMTALFPHDVKRAPLTQQASTSRTLSMVKSYDYTDASGVLLFQACRFMDSATGKKTFKQRRPLGDGKWDWSLKDVEPVLYRLPEVLAAVESGRGVYIVEGEKDADAMCALGYPTTTVPMGAGKWRESFAAVLKGAEVVIFPDNDEPGKAHAEQIAASLVAQDKDALVRVVNLPNLPPKGDISDWLDGGGDLDDLQEIIAKTPRWTGDAIQAAHRTRWRLDELLDNDSVMRPPPVIVPRLAFAGRSTLLAAREKAGKSTLTGFLTAAVSNGGMFLGEPCARGDVLVIGLEEFIGDTARRLRQFRADPKRVYLVDRFAGGPEVRPDELRAHVEAVGPVLVVLDSLTAYSHGQIQDDNNATQMAKVVQPLSDVVHQLGCALIIIHHATKSTGKYRGSTAIGGGVDLLCEFEAPDEKADPTLRRISSVGRLPVPRLYDVRFDGDSYVLATGTEPPLDERIIAIITERPTVSSNDVADAIPRRREEVLNRLADLAATGRIRNNGNGTGRAAKWVVPGSLLTFAGT